ncbi:hypothetical protein DAEQUDRAFT_344606 [Daedalea quercina L-15889]|uniref:Uncharacterized protein n=1 Tax=Daedalea quercina L-15889 TaxID=1314783 RepID=A0A165PH46_9APHY|nr:hypothetical protein DAEQUDRAFT_344606 [Daedalea quercina L-15889]
MSVSVAAAIPLNSISDCSVDVLRNSSTRRITSVHSSYLVPAIHFSYNAFGESAMFLFLTGVVSRSAFASVTNRTIDDQYGDSVTGRHPIYYGDWNYGPTCSGCFFQPSPEDAFMSSWHDTSTNNHYNGQNVSIEFSGTAIWVYCIMPNYEPYSGTVIDIGFDLDGGSAGTFTFLNPVGRLDSFVYNVTVYSATGLTNTQHTLVMTPINSSLLFDWAEYTYDDDNGASASSQSHASSQTSSESGESSEPHPSIMPETANIAMSEMASSLRATSSLGMVPSSVLPSSSLTQNGATSSLLVLSSSSESLRITAPSGSAQGDSTAGARSRTVLISSFVGGGGATVIILLAIAFTLRRRRHRNASQRLSGNILKKPQHKSWATKVDPFMEQLPTDRHVLHPVSAQSISHRRSTSIGISLHGAACDSSESDSVAVSGTALATVGASEVAQPNTLEDEMEAERFMLRVRKFRDQVADLRKWAEQDHLARRG